MRDPNIQPTDEVFAAALGESYTAFSDFTKMLEDKDVKLLWRYYTDGKAWLAKGLYQWKSARGNDKEKTIFWLSVWEGFFKISIFIAEKLRTDILGLPVSQSIIENIQNAIPMGKLRFFPLIFDVHSEALFDDLELLIKFQKEKK